MFYLKSLEKYIPVQQLEKLTNKFLNLKLYKFYNTYTDITNFYTYLKVLNTKNESGNNIRIYNLYNLKIDREYVSESWSSFVKDCLIKIEINFEEEKT